IALDETPRPARVVDRCEPPIAAFVLVKRHASQREAVVQVRARASVDLPQRMAFRTNLQVGEVIAQAAAAAAAMGLLLPMRDPSELLQIRQFAFVICTNLGNLLFGRSLRVTKALLEVLTQSLVLELQLLIGGVRT